jgi:hypothetical protein
VHDKSVRKYAETKTGSAATCRWPGWPRVLHMSELRPDGRIVQAMAVNRRPPANVASQLETQDSAEY